MLRWFHFIQTRRLRERTPGGFFFEFEAIRTEPRRSAQVALKEDAFWDSQPTLCAKGLSVGDFGGVSLSSGFSSQLLWDSQDIPRSVELRSGGPRAARIRPRKA